jgi:predicted porin
MLDFKNLIGIRILLIVVLMSPLFMSFQVNGQGNSPKDSILKSPIIDILDFTQIDFYGSLRAKIAAYDNNLEVQNNSTRIGVGLRSYWNKEKEYSIIGRMEWSVNTVSNDFSFNLDASNTSGLAQIQKVSSKDVFGMRLGFIGLDFGKYGKLTMGKQWGVYYDVAAYTDHFFVFGGSSLGIYVNGTDGGTIGTGRAEKSIQYRLKLNQWDIGTQVQFRGITENSSQGDSYGLSIRYQPKDLNLQFGTAFNTAKISPSTAELLAGFEKDPVSLVAAVNYWQGTTSPSHNSKLYFAMSVASLWGAEAIDVDDITVLYDAIGWEGIFHYNFFRKWGFMAGFNFQFPHDLFEDIHSDFRKEIYIMGLFHNFKNGAYVYLEGSINNSKDGLGQSATNIFTMGFRLNFSTAKERQKLHEYFK